MWRVSSKRNSRQFNGVGKLDWGFGPAGEKPVITDIDALVMNDDKIGALYRFLDPPKKYSGSYITYRNRLVGRFEPKGDVWQRSLLVRLHLLREVLAVLEQLQHWRWRRRVRM